MKLFLDIELYFKNFMPKEQNENPNGINVQNKLYEIMNHVLNQLVNSKNHKNFQGFIDQGLAIMRLYQKILEAEYEQTKGMIATDINSVLSAEEGSERSFTANS